MTRRDWKFVVGFLVLASAIALFQGRFSGKEKRAVDRPHSASVRTTRPVEEILAYEQAGGPPSDALVSRFRVRLDRITRQCDWTKREASDKLLAMYGMLRDDGYNVELLDIAIALDRAKEGAPQDCHEVLALVGILLTRE